MHTSMGSYTILSEFINFIYRGLLPAGIICHTKRYDRTAAGILTVVYVY